MSLADKTTATRASLVCPRGSQNVQWRADSLKKEDITDLTISTLENTCNDIQILRPVGHFEKNSDGLLTVRRTTVWQELKLQYVSALAFPYSATTTASIYSKLNTWLCVIEYILTSVWVRIKSDSVFFTSNCTTRTTVFWLSSLSTKKKKMRINMIRIWFVLKVTHLHCQRFINSPQKGNNDCWEMVNADKMPSP